MQHQLHRYEEHPGSNAGAQPKIFLSVKVLDDAGEDFVVKEAWLEPDEVAAVTKDRAALESIAHRLAAQGEIELEAKLAVKPPAPEVLTEPADLEKLPVVFNAIKIGQQKQQEQTRLAKEKKDAEDKAKREVDALVKADKDREDSSNKKGK